MREQRRDQGSDGNAATWSGAKSSSRQPTLMLVDDEEFLREVGRQFLLREGYQVLQAGSGEEALALFADRPDIDLVILDLGLPGMGGRACMRELLQNDPTVRILVASGYADPKECREALGMGAGGFLGKPFRRQELVEEVAKLLGDRGN